MPNIFHQLFFIAALLSIAVSVNAQQISLKEIMKGKDFTGHWPEREYWSANSEDIYFDWNPEAKKEASHFRFSLRDSVLQEVKKEDKPPRNNKGSDLICYEKQGDIYLWNTEKMQSSCFLETSLFQEKNPQLVEGGKLLLYQQGENVYGVNRINGERKQITHFNKGSEPVPKQIVPGQNYLNREELLLIDEFSKNEENNEEEKEDKNAYYLNGKSIHSFSVNKAQELNDSLLNNEVDDYYFFSLREKPNNALSTAVPNYVTETGYAEQLTARPKVGSEQASYSTLLFNANTDEYKEISTSGLGGFEGELFYGNPVWNSKGTNAIVVIKSMDHKNRWICVLNLQEAKYDVIDHQYDEAWIGGPGIVSWQEATSTELGWVSKNKIWFKSEKTGYSHIYTLTINVQTKKSEDRKGAKLVETSYLPKNKKQLTKGNYETYNVVLSKDKNRFYYGSSEEDSGKRNWNTIKINGSEKQILISKKGRVDVQLSANEQHLLIRYSDAVNPWEIYLASLANPMEWLQITQSKTEEFKKINWLEPEYVDFKARDGKMVRARQYQSESPNGAAVIFVHGAGYLHNAHSWWSQYYREYMFHNLLVEKGYTVLDIDYRGSAGYGRDWRTGIYRHMGGKDLTDQVDGASYLVQELAIDKDRIGIYGGSYGGFITLMALFTEAETFACGAALRSVTDWAHYNHSYTSNILNTPVEDSIAYRRSSPIYFAEGLEDPLLICHGMIDTNVHFQDVVRLSQRLIDLGKENWELAVYPLEGHTFSDPDSWYDEYRRILDLFEENLSPPGAESRSSE